MKFQNLISNIPAVATGGNVIFNLPVGGRIHAFNLFLSSAGVRTPVTTVNLQRVRVTVDTVILIDWDWTSIQLYAFRRGIALSVGQIPIYFTDPMNRGQRNANTGSLDTKQGISNIQVFVQLGVITTPSIAGEYIYDNFTNTKPQIGADGKPTGAMVAFNTPIMKSTQTENVPISANYNIDDIAPSYPIDTITLYNSADVFITSCRLQLNKVVIFEGVPADLAREFLAYGVVTPPGSIVFPFTYDGFAPNSAAGFTTIDIFVTSTTAFACGIALEYQMPSIT